MFQMKNERRSNCIRIGYQSIISHVTCAFMLETPREHTVDLISKPCKAICSLFRQVDEQAGDSDIPATFPVTVGNEAMPERSIYMQMVEPFYAARRFRGEL